MEYRQIDPDLPSLGRWFSLNRRFPRESTLRMLEYEALGKADIFDTAHVRELTNITRARLLVKLRVAEIALLVEIVFQLLHDGLALLVDSSL